MPAVALAPLPAGAQFLNVIESVFSGMARAILANSNYGSIDFRAPTNNHWQLLNTLYGTHCAICHGALGVPRGEIAKGLYPLPPDLASIPVILMPCFRIQKGRGTVDLTIFPASRENTGNLPISPAGSSQMVQNIGRITMP
jgi:hypothetical protein